MTSPTKRGFGPSTAHYEVLRVLGEGGFGKVWECVDVRAGGKQKWAVKQSKEASKQYTLANQRRIMACSGHRLRVL